MRLQLRGRDLLRFVQSRGATLRVLSGRIWLTEEGCVEDWLLGPGALHRIVGDGLVLVSAEGSAASEPSAEIGFCVAENAVRQGPLSAQPPISPPSLRVIATTAERGGTPS